MVNIGYTTNISTNKHIGLSNHIIIIKYSRPIYISKGVNFV